MMPSSEDPAPESGGIDEIIGRMENLYQAVTGRPAPPGDASYAPIPVERDPADYVEEQMNRLLELLGQSQGSPQSGPAGVSPAWSPPLTVCESGSEIVVRVDLPGVPREGLQVTAHGNVLTISGTRPAPTAAEGQVRHSECPTGAFRRTLVMHGAVRGAEPTAHLKDGILEIRVAREGTQPATARPVPVN